MRQTSFGPTETSCWRQSELRADQAVVVAAVENDIHARLHASAELRSGVGLSSRMERRMHSDFNR
jgi:hypothetical protein